MELAVVGNISRDIAWQGTEKRGPFFGGAGLNIAVAIARCGKRPQLISVLGHQDVGLLREIDHLIDTTRVSTMPGDTCQFEMRYTEQGILKELSSRFGVAVFIDSYLQDIDFSPVHHHICCRAPLNAAATLERLVAARIPFSLDFIASSASQQMSNCNMWIEFAECICVNRQEFQMLQEIYDVAKVKKLVVTSGSGPVVVFHYGKEISRHVCSEQEFYDVTGAGDTFAGTFLACYVANREPLKTTISKSIIAAQMSLQGLGIWGTYY